jgi:hypothetical protein
MDDPRILSRRKMRLLPEATREEVLATPQPDPGKPVMDRCSCLFGDFDSDLPRRQAEYVCRVYMRSSGVGKVLQRSKSFTVAGQAACTVTMVADPRRGATLAHHVPARLVLAVVMVASPTRC